MTSLKDFQDSFQRAIMAGDDTILDDIRDTSKEKREVLLGVYRNAYVGRLIDVLEHDYEKLAAYLGEDQFAEMARAFVVANPSRTPNARWFGERLPEFLRETEPYSGQPQLTDLAALEKALNAAFDADDAPALALADLGDLAPEDWPDVIFTPHPASRRLNLASNARNIWTALSEDEAPPDPHLADEPERLIVYRQELTAMFRPLGYEEAMMWDEAAKGVPFGILCELVSTYGGEDEAPARAAGYLQGWIQGGLLAKA